MNTSLHFWDDVVNCETVNVFYKLGKSINKSHKQLKANHLNFDRNPFQMPTSKSPQDIICFSLRKWNQGAFLKHLSLAVEHVIQKNGIYDLCSSREVENIINHDNSQ